MLNLLLSIGQNVKAVIRPFVAQRCAIINTTQTRPPNGILQFSPRIFSVNWYQGCKEPEDNKLQTRACPRQGHN